MAGTALLLALAGCGSTSGRSPQSPTPTDAPLPTIFHTVTPPKGWSDLTKHPPPQYRLPGVKIEHLYVAKLINRLPVAIIVSRTSIPKIITLDMYLERRIRGMRAGLKPLAGHIATPRATRPVDGVAAKRFDVSIRSEFAKGRVRQRFVEFKRGPFAAFSILFTAPSRRSFDRYVERLDEVVASSRWRDDAP